MQQVSLPRFGPAHGGGDVVTAHNMINTSSDGQANLASFLFGPSGDEGMDFDLLAEYLLDDPSSVQAGGPNCSSSCTDIPQVATPESSEIEATLGAAYSDSQGVSNDNDVSGDLAQVQQIIAEHASKVQLGSGEAASKASSTAPVPAPSQIPVVASSNNHVASMPPQAVVVQGSNPNPVGYATVATSTVYQHPGAQVLAGPPAFPPHPAQMSQVALPHPGATAITGAPMATAAGQMTTVVHTSNGTLKVPTTTIGTKRPSDMLGFDFSTGPSRRRPKSEAQVNRRRERNRILARRTRLRKKFFFESLQKEVMDLQRENNALKHIVKHNLDQPTAEKILQETKVQLPEIVLENCGDASELDRQDFSLIKSLQGSQQCFVITDPSLHDNPIVYASAGFLNLTGYSREEVLGRNCRFLQGTDTDGQKVDQIRKAIAVGEDVSVCMVNYCADGTPFWNQLFIAALRDAYNNIVNFVGVLVKVAGPSPDDPEYGKSVGNSEDNLHDEEGTETQPTLETSNHEVTTTGEG